MDKVLLTGATGFLGSYIARLLVEHNYQVTAIHRSSSTFELVESVKTDINWVECELSDLNTLEELVKATDYVIHCAALISWLPKDRKALYECNVQATHDLINLALLHPIKKFLHISSIAALGKEQPGDLISEEAEWKESKLNTDYGITKHLAELEIWRGQAEGLQTLIFNPSLILGAGDWNKGTPALFDKLNRWNPFFPVGSTGMVDVRDVAELVLKGLESELAGHRILATGHNISYRTLISSISEALGKQPPTVAITQPLIFLLPILDAIQCLFTRKERSVSRATLTASASESKFSNTKSKELLSHSYRPMEQTISQTAAAYVRTSESKNASVPWPLLDFGPELQ